MDVSGTAPHPFVVNELIAAGIALGTLLVPLLLAHVLISRPQTAGDLRGRRSLISPSCSPSIASPFQRAAAPTSPLLSLGADAGQRDHLRTTDRSPISAMNCSRADCNAIAIFCAML